MESRPFSDLEQRFVITQILNASKIPVDTLLKLFYESNERPQWEHIFLPQGRTLQECKAVFESLSLLRDPPNDLASTLTWSNPPKRTSASVSVAPVSPGYTARKRHLSAKSGLEKGSQQQILPGPSNGTLPSASTFAAPQPVVKRRGRPPKAEVERRHQEAIARGEVIAPMVAIQGRPSTTSENKSILSSYAHIAPAIVSTRSPGLAESRTVAQSPAVSSSRAHGRSRSSPKSAKKPPFARNPAEGQFLAYQQTQLGMKPEPSRISVSVDAEQPGAGALVPAIEAMTSPSPAPSLSNPQPPGTPKAQAPQTP